MADSGVLSTIVDTIDVPRFSILARKGSNIVPTSGGAIMNLIQDMALMCFDAVERLRLPQLRRL